MIKIFTENGKTIGNGHLSRCLLLYNIVAESNTDVKIYLNENGNADFIKNLNYEFVNWWDKEVVKDLIGSEDYAIVDSYLAPKETLDVISEQSKNTLFFDDFNRVDYPAGIVFCPTLLDKSDRFLTGEEFFLVRKSFYLFKKEKTSSEIRKIFLSIGTDVNNCLGNIIDAILEIDKLVEINVVTNQEFSCDRVKTHYNLDDYAMAKLISDCDFSIIACGQTLLENLVIKNPFVAILTVENQLRNYKFVQEKGLVDYFLDARKSSFIEDFKQVYKEKVNVENLQSFYKNKNLQDSSCAAKKIIQALTKER